MNYLHERMELGASLARFEAAGKALDAEIDKSPDMRTGFADAEDGFLAAREDFERRLREFTGLSLVRITKALT